MAAGDGACTTGGDAPPITVTGGVGEEATPGGVGEGITAGGAGITAGGVGGRTTEVKGGGTGERATT